MKPFALFLCTVLLSLQGFVRSSLFSTSEGGLSNSWTFNFTIFMKILKDRLLYVSDSDQNIMTLSITRRKGGVLLVNLLLNGYPKSLELIKTCGCDPCDETMVNFFLRSLKGDIRMKCNNQSEYRYFTKDKLRENSNTGVSKTMKIAIAAKKTGCLRYFYFNNKALSFKEVKSDFLSSCPRSNCDSVNCNRGKCQALDRLGPACDCSGAALNGENCSKDLTEYSRQKSNSYQRINYIDDVFFKLTWRRYQALPYCLLEIIHRNGSETFMVNGSTLITKTYGKYIIDGDAINYLGVTITPRKFYVKLKNKIVIDKSVKWGDVLINLGFTEQISQCNTFQGTYDFYFNTKDLRQIPIKNSSLLTTNVLYIIGSVVIVLFITVIIATWVCIGHKPCTHKNAVHHKNSYNNAYEGNAVSVERHSDCLGYDYLDEVFFTKKTANAPENDDLKCPELPPRNINMQIV